MAAAMAHRIIPAGGGNYSPMGADSPPCVVLVAPVAAQPSSPMPPESEERMSDEKIDPVTNVSRRTAAEIAMDNKHRYSDQAISPPTSSGEGTLDFEGQRHNALVYARRHLATHMRWKQFLDRGGELPHEKIGNLEHHENALREL